MDPDSREPTDLGTAPVCYRHPDRLTFLSCSQCGRPICGECSIDAAVGQKCPECARATGRTRVVTSRDLQRTSTPVVTGIIALTVLAYFVQRTGAFTPGGTPLEIEYGQINEFVRAGEWWRLLTAAFLHGSFIHIGFNMYALYLFGPSLERRLGSVPFLALYVASALAGGAAFLYLGSDRTIAVGASGAIFGLFGAWFGASYRLRNTPAGRAQFRSLLVLLGINLVLPLMVPNIAWQAHVGGLAAGWIIIFAWLNLAPEQGDDAKRTVIALAIAAISLGLALVA